MMLIAAVFCHQIYDGVLVEAVEYFFNYMREVLVFQRVYLGCNVVGGIGWQHRTLCLEECGTLVVLLVDEMDGDAALGIAALDNGLVHSVAIHALAAVLGEQRRVDVDDAAWIGCNELLWNEQQEACKYHEINVALTEHGDDAVGFHEFGLAHHGCFNAQLLGTLKDVGLWVVGNDK